MQSRVSRIIGMLPERRDEIITYYAKDLDFRQICDDLATAVAALDSCREGRSSTVPAEEYQQLIRELEREAVQFLDRNLGKK